MLSQHTTQSGLSVCTCNEELADLLLCVDDQETVVVRVRQDVLFREVSSV